MIFESALTGRVLLSSAGEKAKNDSSEEQLQRAGSILDLSAQTPEEAHFIREAVIGQGLIEGIFELLRRVPRRLLMVIKLKCVLSVVVVVSFLVDALFFDKKDTNTHTVT
jgi:aarF domain-containing kinase